MKWRHVDLFSGIGGFAVAATWAGLTTTCMCEVDDECREFLKRTWGVPVVGDVRDFDGSRHRGTFLLTGGPPCQPVSIAGPRTGEDDDRWLWPEALRVVAEMLPAWICFENPPGIESMGLNGILSDLEGCGYEIGALEVPACAVNSPQKRVRLWILAHRQGEGSQGADTKRAVQTEGRPTEHDPCGEVEHTESDAVGAGLCEAEPAGQRWRRSGDPISEYGESAWVLCSDGRVRRTKPGVCGLADGVSPGILRALGNAIVPGVAYEILRSIVASTQREEVTDG